jgi:hypothetical protein
MSLLVYTTLPALRRRGDRPWLKLEKMWEGRQRNSFSEQMAAIMSVIRINQARSRGFLIRAGAFSRLGREKTPINGARKSGVKVRKPPTKFSRLWRNKVRKMRVIAAVIGTKTRAIFTLASRYRLDCFFNAIICSNPTKLSLVGPAKEVTK